MIKKLKLSNYKEEIVQFIKFGIVGASNTAISLLVYYLCLMINGNWYVFGHTLGWIISVANSFFWNNKFVFKNKDNNYKSILTKLLKTYFCYGVTFLLSTLLLCIEVEMLHLSKKLSPVANLVLTIPLNYLLNKYWTFRREKDVE